MCVCVCVWVWVGVGVGGWVCVCGGASKEGGMGIVRAYEHMYISCCVVASQCIWGPVVCAAVSSFLLSL